MRNKKIMARGLVIGIMLSNMPVDSLANAINEYEITKEENKDTNIEKEKFNLVDNIKNIIFKIIEPKEGKKIIKINRNIVEGSVLEISLADGEFVPDLTGNPNGYETIRVTTTGSKKLTAQDYSRLKNSGISKIDLSNADSDNIPGGAFSNATHLIEFKFPKGINSIGNSAFVGCNGLTGDLVIPNSITKIGEYAFANCSGFNGRLVIPNSLTNIEQFVFSGCSGLTGDLIIPGSVTTIGISAFSNCSRFTGDLIIPNSVTNIGNSAFYNCKGLNGYLSISNSTTNIGNSAFENCNGFTGDLIIPNSVTSIGNSAFYKCRGFDGILIIPDSVTNIGSNAFCECNELTGDLIIPDSVTTIGGYAFRDCSGFNGNLVISKNITEIGDSTFTGCSGLTGNLIIPNSVNSIGEYAFSHCSGFTGDLIIPDSVTRIDTCAFRICNKIEKILVKINSSDVTTDYKKTIIDNLPDNSQVVIDVPYNFDITGTWLENTNRTVGKPIVKNIIDGIESNLIDNKGQAISLYIPSVYQESNISILKDGKKIALPNKNIDGKYIFTKPGVYELVITTDLGNISNINFEVEDPRFKTAEEAVEKSEVSKDTVDIEDARNLINKLPESLIKDQLQDRLNNISTNLILEKKSTTANLDVYIKSENMLLMSLDTNSVTFEDFSGIEDVEKINAVNISINSSLPYQLNAYLPTEIQNSDKTNIMDKRILNIKENSEVDYKEFTNIDEKVVLKDNCPAGNDLTHGVDLKLVGGIAHEKDVYKATIKFEAEQK